MNVPAMVEKYNLKPKGVIQVGSHHGEEIPMWNDMGVRQFHFEPVRDNYMVIMTKYPNVKVLPVALGNDEGIMPMFTEKVNGGQSCSLLKPKKHLEILPWIVFDGTEHVTVERLDSFTICSEFNFLYVDAQGYELEIFKGAEKSLAKIDFIFTEVNRAEVFEGCGQVEQLDEFLGSLGFKRVETEWHGGDFGDALFVKQ
jgi:FkbM family methyltransferase